MGKVLQYDVSLLESLYVKKETRIGLSKTMLDIQYRSPRELNIFPSTEFYGGRLRTNESNAEVSKFLSLSQFPWPSTRNGAVVPTVFIQCGDEEDMAGRSKSNVGQVDLICRFIPLISTPNTDAYADPRITNLQVTVLSPYTKQIQLLRHKLPSSIVCSTIDSFRGRESDIIVFSTVRCNVEGDVGFLDDPRHLNVMWTRARLGLIIVKDATTPFFGNVWLLPVRW